MQKVNGLNIAGLTVFSLGTVVRSHFDQMATDYQHCTERLQEPNALNLLQLASEEHLNRSGRPVKSWLDAGAGAGMMMKLLNCLPEDVETDFLLNAGYRGAFDFAPGMIKLLRAHTVGSRWYSHSFEADLIDVGRSRLPPGVREEGVDIIFLNNVLHWLYEENSMIAALRNCLGLLKSGGVVIASVAASETGSLFYSSYQRVMGELIDVHRAAELENFLRNPIGFQKKEVVDRLVLDAGFILERSWLKCESILYANPEAYVDDVRGYGMRVLLHPISDRPESEQRSAWKHIKSQFSREVLGRCQEDGYRHQQNTIYFVARCP